MEAENDPLGLLKMEVYVLMELKKTKFQGAVHLNVDYYQTSTVQHELAVVQKSFKAWE